MTGPGNFSLTLRFYVKVKCRYNCSPFQGYYFIRLGFHVLLLSRRRIESKDVEYQEELKSIFIRVFLYTLRKSFLNTNFWSCFSIVCVV